MKLDDKVGQKLKDNRSVKYEKTLKSDAHKAGYHYPSGDGSVSSIQREKESKTLIDQPDNTRSYHYQSGSGKVGELSPIRKMNKYIVGGRVERKRDVIDIEDYQKDRIKKHASTTIVKALPTTATGERRDFVKEYTKDDTLDGSVNNNGKPPKVYERFIRPAERLGNQKIGTSDDPATVDGKREYHNASGKVVGGRSVNGHGYASPIVGSVLAGRPARRSSSNGMTDFNGKAKRSINVSTTNKSSYSERGSFSDPTRKA